MQPVDPNRVAGLKDQDEFSLVLGGPLYQLLRKARLEGDAAGLVRRRISVMVLLTWLPLLLLSMVEGHAWGETRSLSFLADIEMHARLLLALPLLVVAELVVHLRMRPVVRQFLDRGLVDDAALPRFEAAIAAAMKLRNSIAVELLLIAFVFVVGVAFTWRTQSILEVATWSGVAADGSWRPSLAGWWLGCVSMPLFQFLLLRWYFRLFIWARFQWQVSRIDLAFMPTHPDRCGGLGFIGAVSYAFAPVLLAQGTLLAGMMANRILYAGARLPEFKLELIGLVGVMLFAILGPMLAFAPKLAAAKRTGLREYGTLAQTYVRDFDRKWLRGGARASEALVGSPDVQSLADLDSSYQVVKEMRMAPFNLRTVFELGVATLLPVGPLLLTMISLEELLDRLLKVLF
ncbi:MAG: hypothetical protein KA911_08370 [Xanthomonadales bacterium]|nr:hypothetical protein [Xanthomonadales bacterium]